MKTEKRIGTLATTAVLAATIVMSIAQGTARAEETYPSDGDHPLRIANYFVWPAGTVLEWTVTRPLWRVGQIIAPYHHIDYRGFQGCNKERPSRACTNVIK